MPLLLQCHYSENDAEIISGKICVTCTSADYEIQLPISTAVIHGSLCVPCWGSSSRRHQSPCGSCATAASLADISWISYQKCCTCLCS